MAGSGNCGRCGQPHRHEPDEALEWAILHVGILVFFSAVTCCIVAGVAFLVERWP